LLCFGRSFIGFARVLRWTVGVFLLRLRSTGGRWLLLDLGWCGDVLWLGFGRWRGGVC
jgi:hypothetical protein